jgi:hypothetical protein
LAQPLEFERALKQARLAEAFHLDALINVKDARSLRLHSLRDELLPALKELPAPREFLELNIAPGETPRLWIDLISSVVIAPDTRIYRFEQERSGEREVLKESEDLDEMKHHILRYLAHRVLERERSSVQLSSFATSSPLQKYTLAALAYAWVTGAAFALLACVAAAMLLGKLKF